MEVGIPGTMGSHTPSDSVGTPIVLAQFPGDKPGNEKTLPIGHGEMVVRIHPGLSPLKHDKSGGC